MPFGEPRYWEGSLKNASFTSPNTATPKGIVVINGVLLPFLGKYPGGSYRQEWMKDESNRGKWKSFA